MENVNTWTVVKFMDDEEVEAVPSKWLTENFCSWPLFPATGLAHAKNECEQVGKRWVKFPIKLFRYATFDRGLERTEYAKNDGNVVVNSTCIGDRNAGGNMSKNQANWKIIQSGATTI